MMISETFRSIQGEGKRIGALTYFIRTVGCNLDCSWCDTQYAMNGGGDVSIEELIDLVASDDEICLTGGEPLLHPESAILIEKLTGMGKTVVVETNGSVDLSNMPNNDNVIYSMDIKCPSSHMEDRMMFSNIDLLQAKDQVKFVISDGNDLEYAISVVERYSPKCEVIFSPVGGMDIEPLAEEIIARRLKVRVLPQLHKLIWGNKKGV